MSYEAGAIGASKPALIIHQAHSLNPGEFTCVVGNQSQAAFTVPRLPTYVKGHVVNEIILQLRITTTLDGVVTLYGLTGNHWNITTDTYAVQASPPDDSTALVLSYPVVATTAGQIEPIGFFALTNPTQGF